MSLLRLTLLATLLAGCPAPPEEAAKPDEVEQLKKRVTRLETRLRQIETRLGKPGAAPGRGKAPPGGKKPPGEAPAGPMRQVQVQGEAKAVMLTGEQRRFRLPGQVPVGDYSLLVAFGEDPLAKKGEITIPEGDGPLVLNCTTASDTCKVK